MSDPLLVMTWLWRQTPDRHGYFADAGGADKVNVWADMFRRNCGLNIELACVTDCPDGIDPSIRIIPLPRDFDDIYVKQWSTKTGAPQCYRRLLMFHPKAADIFGAERFVSMDLDVVIRGRVDRLFDNDCDFVMFKGTSKSRPYNGSMLQMTAGARSAVFTEFAKDPQAMAEAARKKFIGSDQAVISMILGKGEETWSVADGVEAYGGGFMRRYGSNPRRLVLPESVKIVFFPGPTKPWQLLDRVGFIAESWHDGVQRGKARGRDGLGPASRRLSPGRIPPFYTLDDRQKWGRRFKIAADKATRRPTRLFIREQRVPEGARVFARVDTETKYGEPARSVFARLHARAVITLPTRLDLRVVYDLGFRKTALAPWLAKDPSSPARYRIAVVGAQMYGIRLKDGASLLFQSVRQKAAGRLVAALSKTFPIQWIAFDLALEDEHPRIVEAFASWDDAPLADAPMVDLSLKRTNLIGADCFRVAVDVLSDLKREIDEQAQGQQAAAG